MHTFHRISLISFPYVLLQRQSLIPVMTRSVVILPKVITSYISMNVVLNHMFRACIESCLEVMSHKTDKQTLKVSHYNFY